MIKHLRGNGQIPGRRIFSCLALVLPSFLVEGVEANGNQPNFLFIVVDDLRPELGCYGIEKAVTPNMDRLASTGVTFDRAYAMVPTCGASRASLFTSVRPARDRFVFYNSRADVDAPWASTLNTVFTEAGYQTVSVGKVFHHLSDNEDGWSEAPWQSKLQEYQLESNRVPESGKSRGYAYERADVPDSAYRDGEIANVALQSLDRLSRMDSPFFLAVGFIKPHLPFVAPEKYWAMHDDTEFRLPESYHPPHDAPEWALHNWGELRHYSGIPEEGPLDDQLARKLIHGYYAATSYIDSLIGRLLDELDRLSLKQNTVVVLFGDHGWNLGDHGLWCKHSCFEVSMRVPLIFHVPGGSVGKHTPQITELIDLYPTLCELAGIPIPDHVEGKSLVPALVNPDNVAPTTAIGRHSSGDTIRTHQYRYTKYTTPEGEFLAQMLHDHLSDPDERENIAEEPGKQAAVDTLSRMLAEGMGLPSPP